jgi:outer membrane receptor protein involved in Fe transport
VSRGQLLTIDALFLPLAKPSSFRPVFPYMKKVLFIFLLSLFSVAIYAQNPAAGKSGNGTGRQMSTGHFYGRILDETSGKGIEFATIQLFQTGFDSVKKQQKRKLITGALTAANGDFSLENVPVKGNFQLHITAIGYDSLNRTVSFDFKPGGQQQFASADKDLGNMKLKPLAITLSEVVITDDEPIFQLELDKKVYNVEKDISNAGGTAEDVLKKVPSVLVDIDGNVTLRNAAPQIFVDGRPTTLTIDQIPSDAIEKIEVITNPSAKYDASGGQSGIINIIMKKSRRIGYNGNLRAGIDKRGKVNAGGDINIREGKINVFAGANINQRKSISYNNTERYNTFEEPQTNIFQVDTPINNNQFLYGNGGIDYFVNNRNTFTLSGSYTQGKFNSNDKLFLTTDTLVDAGISSSQAIRNTESFRQFHNAGGALLYKHLFPKEGKTLSADVNYNKSKSDNNSNYLTQYYDTQENPIGSLGQQQQEGGGSNRYITLQSDYVDPITEDMQVEAGVRAALRKFTSQNEVSVFDDSLNEFVIVPDVNNYTYNDQVYAGYATFSGVIDKFQYKAGLRVESSFYSGVLTDANESYKNNFPLSLFPSGSLNYELNQENTLQLNYSRRIDRPGFFQLMPYTDYSDSLNLQRGNPDLLPQFTNTVELNFERSFDKSNSILTSAYFKGTNNKITRYQELEYDSLLMEETIISTYENANSSYLVGLELTSTNSIKKWFSISTNLNLFQSFIDGTNIESGLTNSQFSWFAKVNASFKLPLSFTIQLSGEYQSKTAVPQSSGGGGRGMGGGFFGTPPATLQGYVEPMYEVDISVKKEFFKNKATATLSFSDIFATDRSITHYDTDYFTQNSSRIRDPQFIRLNFSYKFGKFDSSIFKRKNTNGGEMMQDMGG